LVVKSLSNENGTAVTFTNYIKQKGVALKPYDIIKLGRFKFLIREIKTINYNDNGMQVSTDIDVYSTECL
jgi:hypothetical protein